MTTRATREAAAAVAPQRVGWVQAGAGAAVAALPEADSPWVAAVRAEAVDRPAEQQAVAVDRPAEQQAVAVGAQAVAAVQPAEMLAVRLGGLACLTPVASATVARSTRFHAAVACAPQALRLAVPKAQAAYTGNLAVARRAWLSPATAGTSAAATR